MKIYQVDAFAKELFQGNPAAVVPLKAWLPDALMQNIAMETNLADTAFLVPSRDGYEIRWFTPAVEVDLCGHATLASGHVLFEHLGFAGDSVVFYSRRSGELRVSREPGGDGGMRLSLDLPVNQPREVEGMASVFEGLRIAPRTLFKGAFDYMVVLDSRQEVQALEPDFKILAAAPGRGVVATARGGAGDEDRADFVSRCFFPRSGIDEDPVTGSAHTMLVPYWAGLLGKTRLSAVQLSRRRGYLDCLLAGDRVRMSGYAKTFLTGELCLPEMGEQKSRL
ncbi:MAG: PhzF family phenazine biosynthesis protein [Bacteroidota bacterium]|nr:PhzF family phenazine biosynthesis protein [Bacteroidota bacterium]MDP4216466.1 PhzF family phenazine biosynthesis protein [Bacteroidota bacterium]MDP4246041.1 PhzF family phenazine biosynthesis protein [Bacteroidota bacterium]MDP4252972.1 PhzF family phenazine biosynthesis protein [Bacteroidota bacterium]MDP4259060.1 PhzF family phenazine biosynthesis protein [Bacteroidota bacterium]